MLFSKARAKVVHTEGPLSGIAQEHHNAIGTGHVCVPTSRPGERSAGWRAAPQPARIDDLMFVRIAFLPSAHFDPKN